jgi:hypothetical protein
VTSEEMPQFRELSTELMQYEGQAVNQDVLLPWLTKARQALDTLRHYQKLPLQNEYRVKSEDLWQWYALSRVNDFLLLSFQVRDDFYAASPRRGNLRSVSVLAPEDYLGFFASLGFRSFTHLPYSPFHFEIVEVVETAEVTDADTEEIAVDHVFWPGLMFGEMLFSRAGVRVRGPSRLICKSVAETSRLYFTYRRLRRQTLDLSHGWGSNSQWRTGFRRDYDSSGQFCYNVDGTHPLGSGYRSSFSPRLGEEENDLTLAERIELLTNRCFVQCQKNDHDLFPFGDSYHEARP